MGLFDHLKDKVKGKIEEVRQEATRTHGSIPTCPPGKEEGWEVIPEVSDEFDGSQLDTSKWEPFNKNWKGRAPGWFSKDNVKVEDGCMQLTCKFEEPPRGYPVQFHTFSTAFVRSKAQVKYGYFEALVQPSDSITSSAWWFVRNDRETWNEIDVFEVSQARGHECKFHTNAHVFRVNGEKLAKTLSHPSCVELDDKCCAKVFRVGMEWDENFIQWLVDGRVVRRQKNEHWHSEMWVQFDCETMGNWFGLPDKEDGKLPATFRVFYVRAWRKL